MKRNLWVKGLAIAMVAWVLAVGTVVAQARLPGDIDGNGAVNALDFVILFEQFALQPLTDSRADLTGDGAVNALDYVVLFEHWGQTGVGPSATPALSPSIAPTGSGPLPTPGASMFTPVRFAENPIIRPAMLPGSDGENINGPSLVKVPDWLPNKLGSYYLYFAHHRGRYIRLAYSNNLHGPWNIYAPGTLKLSQAAGCSDHVASPDIHLDDVRKEIIMYLHCPYGGSGQKTLVATSEDGINFTAQPQTLGLPYFRVFEYGGYYYALGKRSTSQVLYRSTGRYSGFVEGRTIFNARHTAVFVEQDTAYIFYSRIGDSPERILLSTMNLSGAWSTWTTSPPIEIMRSELDYEGVNLPIAPSEGGAASGPVHQLRDPAVYREAGKLYLLYSVAGEQGIGVAELIR